MGIGDVVMDCPNCSGSLRVKWDNDDMPDYVECDTCESHGYRDSFDK